VSAPQTGIFALGTSSHAWLEFDVLPSTAPADAVALIASLREPRTTLEGVNLVVGFRPEIWAAIAPDAAPAGAHGFETPNTGPTGQVMPATQHDIVVWITGSGYDVVFDVSRSIVNAVAGRAALAHEMVGWPYHHDRDLTGFIDGTENPSLIEAMSLALIPEGEPGAGGSILLLQQWEHDAALWEGLPTEAQEAVIGRRKMDSVELDPRPDGSHVARTDQDAFGTIFRRNIAYGSVERHGTIFVGFSASQAVLAGMLDSMVGRPGGQIDELMLFTRPLTGAYYVVPSADRVASAGSSQRGRGPSGD
jgi:putative iron-dependent peroxidase